MITVKTQMIACLIDPNRLYSEVTTIYFMWIPIYKTEKEIKYK